MPAPDRLLPAQDSAEEALARQYTSCEEMIVPPFRSQNQVLKSKLEDIFHCPRAAFLIKKGEGLWKSLTAVRLKP